VQLPDVDVVGAETPQGRLKVGQQCASGGVDHALAVADSEPGLRRDDELLACDVAGTEQPSDHALRVPRCVGGSRVDEASACGDEAA